jgi:hypothetical protein
MNLTTSIFNNCFLDTLHQFFPDVLYTDRFQTRPREFIQYLQTQTQLHFPQYHTARLQYNNTVTAIPVTTVATDASGNTTVPTTTTATTTGQSLSDYVSTVTTTGETLAAYVSTITGSYDVSGANLVPETTSVNILNTLLGYTTPVRSRRLQYFTPASTLRNMIYADDYIYYNTDTTNLFTNLLNIMNPIPLAPMENVIVFPTNDQIASASRTFSTESQLEECCAICQEDIESSVEVRQIRQCTHVFHKDCVDQWFEQSVFCPICRLDIRETDYR